VAQLAIQPDWKRTMQYVLSVAHYLTGKLKTEHAVSPSVIGQ
jgi:hypothetical protein